MARELASRLRAAGQKVWIAADNIQPGEKWLATIDRGLAESGIFIILLTPNSAASKWVKHETEIAIQENVEGDMRILPLKLAACHERDFLLALKKYQFIDAVSNYEQGLQQLFDRLGIVDPQAEVRRLKAEVESLKTQLALSLQEKGEAIAETKRIAGELQVAQQQLAQKEAALKAESTALAAAKAETAALQQKIDRLTKDKQALQQALDKALAPPSVKDRHILTLAAGVTLELVRVSAGEFLYGDNKEKRTLPEYWMGKTPVTVAQFQAFLNSKPNFTPDSYWRSKIVQQQANHPAKQVSWQEAQLFCEWASKASGTTVTLPTELQWEKAARGTDGREYPWGNAKPDDTRCNFNKSDAYLKASGDDNYKFTTPVGSYSPQGDSPYGCVDMAGNVWEWCEDVYENIADARVLRGGSFSDHVLFVRCAYRHYANVTDHNNSRGVRVCVPLLPPL